MIFYQEPGMLFAIYLFRPRSRAASRRANILFKDMAASTRKRKGKWSEKMREGMMMWWLFISTSKLIGWYDTRISELLLHCRSLNGALANITVPGVSDYEKQQEGRGHIDLIEYWPSLHKSGSVLVGNVHYFYNCELRVLCFCCQCWAL